MDRFEEAKLGDLVYCRLRGDGVITSVICFGGFMIECFFGDDTYCEYDYSGRSDKYYVEPTLFYRKGNERYLEKRPELEIDWSKVPIGTKVEVSDFEDFSEGVWNLYMLSYIPTLIPSYWVRYSDTVEESRGYRYCKLAEPCKPEWVKR